MNNDRGRSSRGVVGARRYSAVKFIKIGPQWLRRAILLPGGDFGSRGSSSGWGVGMSGTPSVNIPEVSMPQRKGGDVDEDGLAVKITNDTRRLSQTPSAIKARIRRNGGRAAEDIALFHEITYGEVKPVSEWTLEELQRGRPRHPTGGWRGPRPKWITPIIQAEIRRRLREETIATLVGHTGSAIKVLAEFLKNEEEPHLRFKAAQLIIEYAAGSPDKNVHITGNVQLQTMLASALVLDDGSPAHPVIEGSIVTRDNEGEEDDDGED